MVGETPARAAADELQKAQLEIVHPAVTDPFIPLRFNPSEYRLTKTNKYDAIVTPGLETPSVHYVGGSSEKLNLDVLLDTTDTMESVRDRYVEKLSTLMKIKSELHAPPIVRFLWDTAVFRGVVERMDTVYVMFTPQGVPVRAQVSLSLIEYRRVEEQTPKGSPDTEKSITVRRGDTLNGIAAAAYQDATKWREIARANAIRDPRRLEPGQVLLLPRLV